MVSLVRLSILMASLILLGGCQPGEAPPLDQQVYIWQRQWTPAHEGALSDSRGDFSTLRILALQAFPGEGWVRARINPALLKADGRPVIAVVRLDGQLRSLNQGEILAQIQQVLTDWTEQGVIISGVEIDHDAGTARLPEYQKLLVHLRSALPTSLTLSITALPSWLNSRALPALLASVDSSVLQVHAVDDPRKGLFDPTQARKWAVQWSSVTAKPFYLALPAYGVALLTGDGVPRVESEVAFDQGGERRELLADPQQLSQLAAELRSDQLKHLAGLIWFRLPLSNDRRAWSLTTLRAVVQGVPLDSRLSLKVSGRQGLHDISLSNEGNLDTAWPVRMTLAVKGCEGADALAGYTLQQSPELLTFTRQREGRILAGGQRAIGWARCTSIEQGNSNVYP